MFQNTRIIIDRYGNSRIEYDNEQEQVKNIPVPSKTECKDISDKNMYEVKEQSVNTENTVGNTIYFFRV